jgi:hypothetical protein
MNWFPYLTEQEMSYLLSAQIGSGTRAGPHFKCGDIPSGYRDWKVNLITYYLLIKLEYVELYLHFPTLLCGVVPNSSTE